MKELRKSGIRFTDPRLSTMMRKFDLINPNPPTTTECDLNLDVRRLQIMCAQSSNILNKAFQQKMIIPKFSEFCDDISSIYEKVRKLRGYINSPSAKLRMNWIC